MPPSLGVVLPNVSEGQVNKNRGLQEERVERDAWKGILDALTRMKASLEAEDAPPEPAEEEPTSSEMQIDKDG